MDNFKAKHCFATLIYSHIVPPYSLFFMFHVIYNTLELQCGRLPLIWMSLLLFLSVLNKLQRTLLRILCTTLWSTAFLGIFSSSCRKFYSLYISVAQKMLCFFRINIRL
jgi:hypothetical protein